jgi:hypothetical protein
MPIDEYPVRPGELMGLVTVALFLRALGWELRGSSGVGRQSCFGSFCILRISLMQKAFGFKLLQLFFGISKSANISNIPKLDLQTTSEDFNSKSWWRL